jgi:UbiA prenyltransferase family protein
VKLGIWLRLGRVSNLPTVWSNVLATLALSAALVWTLDVLWSAAIFSAYYVGGMYLNDAFDHRIDAQQRPTRPIPSGQVSARLVYLLGFSALLVATALLALLAQRAGVSVSRAALSGALLGSLIVLYDAYHKQNPLSPVLMGACRVMIYVAGAYAVRESLTVGVLWGAAMLLCYLIGLTYAAKQEALNRLTRVWPLGFVAAPMAYGLWLASHEPLVWPFLLGFVLWVLYALSFLSSGPRRSVPQAVVRLIAGIALLDGMLIASTGAAGWAVCAASFCAITRLFQRVIPGT